MQLIHIIINSLEWIGQYKKEINNKITILFYECLATRDVTRNFRLVQVAWSPPTTCLAYYEMCAPSFNWFNRMLI